MRKILPKNEKQILTTIIIISVTLRVLASLYLGDQVVELPGTADQISYQALAMRVLSGYGFTFGQNWWPATAAGEPTAHWSYLYTIYLVVVYHLFGPHPLLARLIQAVVVGIVHPLLAYALGRRVFNRTVGLVTAAWTAVYGYFIYYAATIMTEPYYITTIVASLYLAIVLIDRTAELDGNKPQSGYYILALAFGFTLGVTVLLRQLFLLVIPFIFIWIWLSARIKGKKSVIPTLIISTIVIILLILPFTAFNYVRFNRMVLLNTNAGYAFFWGNHPVHGTHFIPAREKINYLALIPPELRTLDEAALDQELLKLGLKFVTDDPYRYFLLSLSRIPSYFMFWPLGDSDVLSNITRVVSFGLALPLMLLGIIRWLKEIWGAGRVKLLSSPKLLLLLIAFVYTGIHLLTWALVRYRLPVDAILLIFAAYGLVEICSKVKVRSQPSGIRGTRRIARHE